jgi:tetratricopeptide (TPR) repeat protein
MVEMIQKGVSKTEISQEVKAQAKEIERDVNSNMAMVYLKEENYSKAIEKATKSIQTERTAKAYFRRAKAYAMKNDFENAYKG